MKNGVFEVSCVFFENIRSAMYMFIRILYIILYIRI